MHKEIILSEQPPKNKTKQKVISNKAENVSLSFFIHISLIHGHRDRTGKLKFYLVFPLEGYSL